MTMVHSTRTARHTVIRAVFGVLSAVLAMLIALSGVPAFAAPLEVPGYTDENSYSDIDDTPVQDNPIAWEQQDPLAIYAEGIRVTALEKTYGDADFTLTATGGSVSGFFWWYSDNPFVAEINQDGRVHIHSAGQVNIWLWRMGGLFYYEAIPTYVHLSIAQARPTLSTVNPPVAAGLSFGSPLAASAISGELLGVEGTPLAGSFAWETEELATLVPGSSGHESSIGPDGRSYRVRQDGVYYASALFTPDPKIYGDSYVQLALLVKVPVYASENTRVALEAEAVTAADTIRPRLRQAEENYDADTLARFYRAVEAVERALAPTTQASSQDTTEALLSELEAARAALRHDHSLLTNSADTGVSETGRSVTLRLKGEHSTVTSILLNGRSFDLGTPDADSGERALSFQGRPVGTVRAGSVIIELDAAFVDSLDNGSFTVAVHFDDGYQTGSGSASFTVSRTSSLPGGDSRETAVTPGSEEPVLLATPDTAATVAVIVDESTPLGAPASSSYPDSRADNGEENPATTPEALAAIKQSQALADTTAFWVLIVPLVAAAVAVATGTLIVQGRKLLRRAEKDSRS